MVSAGVEVSTTAQSLEDLIRAFVPTHVVNLPSNGRVMEIHIQYRVGSANDFHLVYKAGTVNLATDSGFLFTATDNYLEMRSPSGNQLSLREMFLVSVAGIAQARIGATIM